MDTDALTRALDRLAQTSDHPPTLAHIWREHDARRTLDYGWTRPEDTGPPISLDEYLTHHPEHSATLRP